LNIETLYKTPEIRNCPTVRNSH